jgi:hypothetical protein
MSGIPSFIDEKQYIRMKDTNQITTTDNNGDVATVMYSIIGSTPPQGLQIDEITGIISGTPTSSGAGVLTIKATGTTDNWNGLECYSDIGYNIEPSSAKSIALFGETELLIPFKTSYTYTSSIAEAIITTSGLPSGFVFDGHTLTTPESVTNAGKFNLTATFGNLTCTKEISYFPSSGFENNRLILIEGSINNFTFEPIPIIISDGVMQPPSITASQKDLTIGIYFTNFDEEVNVISDGFLSGFNKLVNIDISKLCNVTSIGNNFCNGCRKLSSIDLSPLSNVQTIGSYFLTGCSSLTNVNLDALSHIDNVMDNFLEGCSKLVSINLNPLSNVTNIANNFLRNCSSLTNIDLSSLTNLRVIGNDFLNSCKNIRSVNFNNQSNINSVGDGFLYICSNLISFDLHPLHNIQNIGANFLYRCTKLNSVDLSPLSNVTTIGECFLLGCIGLTDLDLSPLTGLSTIKSRFLEECTRLISVNLSSLNVLSTIQNNFFYSCNGLRYINIGNVD